MQAHKIANGKQKAHQLIKKGKFNEAILLLNKFKNTKPVDAEIFLISGSCHINLSNWDKAIAALKQCIQLESGAAQAYYLLGSIYSEIGEHSKAFPFYEATIKISNYSIAEAHAAKGRINLAQGLVDDAKKEFDIAINKQPHLIDAYLGYAAICQQSSQYQDAINTLKKALSYEPKNPRILCPIATCLANLLQKDEAMTYYKRALRANPQNAEATAGLAMMLNFKGKYKEAAKLISPLISKNILRSSLGVAYAQCCHINKDCDKAVAYAETLFEELSLSKVAEKNLHFAVAKVLDRSNDYDNAFQHYKKANDSIKQMYDSVTHTQRINSTIEAFSVDAMLSLPRANNNDSPIFIVGMPRSGTSLTEQILAAHPSVYAAGELDDLSLIISRQHKASGSNKAFSDQIKSLSSTDINNMAQQYLNNLNELSKSATHHTDKMPHNFFLLGYIQVLFPNARIIHCRRNPLDTCLSIYFQNFNEQHTYAKSLFDIGTHYFHYERLMKHWDSILTMPIFEINYEDLISSQEETTRALLEFCGLPWDEKCLEFHNVKRTVDTASHDQVRQKLYSKSVARWKHYDKHLDDLKEGLERAY